MQKLLSEIKILFTENFACFRKFWVYQFVISLLGVMVTLPLSAFISLHPEFGIIPYIAALIFCGGMFCFLIYYTMFEQGARDYIRVTAHKAEAEPLKGLWISLIAYAPTAVIALLDVIFALCSWGTGYTITHVTLNVVIHAQYSAFMYLFPTSLGFIGDFISLIFAPLFGFLGYWLASHDKTLRGVFGIKVKRNRE